MIQKKTDVKSRDTVPLRRFSSEVYPDKTTGEKASYSVYSAVVMCLFVLFPMIDGGAANARRRGFHELQLLQFLENREVRREVRGLAFSQLIMLEMILIIFDRLSRFN
jgi:hypothetical protein